MNDTTVAHDDPARQAFLTQPLGALIVKNTVPAVVSLLVMTAYQVTDGIMVGRSLGHEALAAVNVIYPVVALLVGLAVMLGTGANARMAVLLGAGQTAEARKVLGFVLALGSGLGMIGTLSLWRWAAPLLALMGTDGALHAQAAAYLGTLVPFAVPVILFFILEQAVRNDGRAGFASAVMVGTAIVNIGLDYVFLFLLQMGIEGAALASGLAQMLGAILFVGYFALKTLARRPGLAIGRAAGSWRLLGAIAANGSSELLNCLAAGITTFLFNRILLDHAGAEGVAAFTLVQYLILVAANVFMGISMGSQPILSYNHGAGQPDRVRGTLMRILAAALVFGALGAALMQSHMRILITLFLPHDVVTQTLSQDAGSILSWSLFLMPVGLIGSVFFTALEMVRHSLVVSLFRSLILILVGLAVLPALFGLTGVWLTPVFAEAGTAIVTMVLIAGWLTRLNEADVPCAMTAES
jgi:putative MATE family efflux protein